MTDTDTTETMAGPKTISELMDAFGGTAEFARIVNLKVTTAHEMKRSGSIRVIYWRKIIAAAAERGIKGVSSETLMRLQGKRSEPRAKAERRFTGKPCKRGHIGERYASRDCVECTRQRGITRRQIREEGDMPKIMTIENMPIQ